jgi:hypothetical protein
MYIKELYTEPMSEIITNKKIMPIQGSFAHLLSDNGNPPVSTIPADLAVNEGKEGKISTTTNI